MIDLNDPNMKQALKLTEDAVAAQVSDTLRAELASMTKARDYCLRTMNEAIEENTTLREALREWRDVYGGSTQRGKPCTP